MTITINKLQIGDRLIDSPQSKYGYFTNRIVKSIRTTKAGRFVIEIQDQYVNASGEISAPRTSAYTNGAIVGHTEVTLHN
jgi:hypothetical protein